MTLYCVSGRVGSLHLLGSSFVTFEDICTKFTHISACIIYILVLDDVISSDVGEVIFLAHTVYINQWQVDHREIPAVNIGWYYKIIICCYELTQTCKRIVSHTQVTKAFMNISMNNMMNAQHHYTSYAKMHFLNPVTWNYLLVSIT